MNDPTNGVSACAFHDNIDQIVSDSQSVHADVILVAPALSNPNWQATTLGVRIPYRDALRQIAQQRGTGFADMMQVHQTLLGWSATSTACESAGTCTCADVVTSGSDGEPWTPKTYEDQTGNDKNHPGDWLIRWYAQEVGALLAP